MSAPARIHRRSSRPRSRSETTLSASGGRPWPPPARRPGLGAFGDRRFVPYAERHIMKFLATETIHRGVTLLSRIIAQARALAEAFFS
jgi:hypothetical protein